MYATCPFFPAGRPHAGPVHEDTARTLFIIIIINKNTTVFSTEGGGTTCRGH